MGTANGRMDHFAGSRLRLPPPVSFTYLVHGVEQLGELVEALPVLAGVLLALHYGFAQLLDVRHADVVEHRLALQAVLWHCGGEKHRRQRGKERKKSIQSGSERAKHRNIGFPLTQTAGGIMRGNQCNASAGCCASISVIVGGERADLC